MKKPTPVEYLRSINANSADAFQALRAAVTKAGPLDAHTVELIVLGGLVTAGSERSFRTHALRLLKDKVDPQALRQAVLVTLAASASFNQVISALEWVDDVVREVEQA
ncbi:MAG TPA: carboxymuconolactone decarboxylase family protein [Methylovirgula sp.]